MVTSRKWVGKLRHWGFMMKSKIKWIHFICSCTVIENTQVCVWEGNLALLETYFPQLGRHVKCYIVRIYFITDVLFSFLNQHFREFSKLSCTYNVISTRSHSHYFCLTIFQWICIFMSKEKQPTIVREIR